MNENTARVVVGLGNPGPRHVRNRHNVGFMVLDLLAQRLGLSFDGESDQWQVASGPQIHLVKPLTYMNRSGLALSAWAQARKLNLTGRAVVPAGEPVAETDLAGGEQPQPEAPGGIRPLVVCDDLALPLGSVRLRARGSSGGQNGLASIIENLEGPEFPRLRLGIAPVTGPVAPAGWSDHVLADFGDNEAEAAAEMVLHAVAALEFWLDEGLAETISRFNRRVRPDE